MRATFEFSDEVLAAAFVDAVAQESVAVRSYRTVDVIAWTSDKLRRATEFAEVYGGKRWR